ncbi:hypothetical protein [Dyadobacter frigoris]|uniref:Uncharacterized protein n=1 Tax=Dyadobacter frigoris TaxID=2576211 RepID=A0A4U6DEC8_9BACT|nr:hypothetical protein [Dyadobacter frigoris]TKT92854.1 hypothetical protein FDK13_08675 [Dyadobacter frigoris]GLU54377.1 hypothetical protein Dfri01_38380 [Dyadobacter frigoris]
MRIFIIVILFFLTCCVGLFINQEFFGKRYQFEKPIPFSGPAIYNPYKSITTKNWVKCNFHAHTKVWLGITNGHGTAKDIHAAYKDLHYGFHAVSNYHDIDTTEAGQPNYISAYEHGYNYNKTHQLVLGSSEVTWLDYLFTQSINNKQYIIERLHQTGSVVILNHPGLRKGYSTDELSKLNGYDCMEVLNPSVISTAGWDAALSAGKQVFIVGDDDIHDVFSKDRLGQMCTFVNVSENQAENVFRALKTGQSYGVVIGSKQQIDSIPRLQNLSLSQDTISIQMDQSAKKVTLTGQNGRILAHFKNTGDIKYVLRENDHYVRATFFYKNGTQVYLNPVFFIPKSGYIPFQLVDDNTETLTFRLLGTILISVWLVLIRRLIPKKKKLMERKLKSIHSNAFGISE